MVSAWKMFFWFSLSVFCFFGFHSSKKQTTQVFFGFCFGLCNLESQKTKKPQGFFCCLHMFYWTTKKQHCVFFVFGHWWLYRPKKTKKNLVSFFVFLMNETKKNQWTPKNIFQAETKDSPQSFVFLFFLFWQSVISKCTQWAYFIAYGDYFTYYLI